MIHISKLNEIVKGTIHGNDDIYIKGPCSIQRGKKDYISYIKNKNYLKYLKNTLASAIIVDQTVKIPKKNIDKTLLRVDNAALAFINSSFKLSFILFVEIPRDSYMRKTSTIISFIYLPNHLYLILYLELNFF